MNLSHVVIRPFTIGNIDREKQHITSQLHTFRTGREKKKGKKTPKENFTQTLSILPTLVGFNLFLNVTSDS